MRFVSHHQKKIASLFLVLFAAQLFAPFQAYALTSGPSQPEMQGFTPIGNSDMVDLFSGDFSYNIPLMDVGGYPVNMSYHSGASLDDEASWVGYGWSLSVGALNRQMRGLPDDFNGTDQQEREFHVKDHIVKGGSLSGTLDLLGIPVGKIAKKIKKKKLDLKLTLSAGVKIDNYRGIGADIGLNSGVSLTNEVATDKTSKGSDSTTRKAAPFSGSAKVNLSSFDGANINSSVVWKKLSNDDKLLTGSFGFNYNSRAGLTNLTLSGSNSRNNSTKNSKPDQERGFERGISFSEPGYTPTIDHPTKSSSYTFSLHLGAEFFVAYGSPGITGFYSKTSTGDTRRSLPAYGYLYSEQGKNDAYALHDLNREKDIPYSPQINYLPVPVPTYDLFTASSQAGGGQYRAYRGSSGVYSDPKTETKDKNYTLGVELGAGIFADMGADLNYQTIKSTVQKWNKRNGFLASADFVDRENDPAYEKTYFKKVGESTPVDKNYLRKIRGVLPFAAALKDGKVNPLEGAEVSGDFRTPFNKSEGGESLVRDAREVRNSPFSYLTAKEATHHALDKSICNYEPDSLGLETCSGSHVQHISRTSGYRKGHHISEVTITGDDGKRSIYGIPAYNIYQENVSFSVPSDTSHRKRGLIGYHHNSDDGITNKNGRDWYFSREITKPYAISYLLTSILSTDYVDKTGDGISDDDLGTAVKFNYTKLPSLFKWRTPFAFGKDSANYNEGLLSDNLDDKANYVYGEKELWYLHSIESKTMVAQFITGDRNDALGVLSAEGELDTVHRQKYLKEIRLYSKSDLKAHFNNPALTTPIKVVHFVYDYSVCKGLPNSLNKGGKLTLKQVYFTFGTNNKGILNPYRFTYDTTQFNQYAYRQYDRWGNFKNVTDNPGGLNNGEYPYVLQDTALTNQYSRVSQLTAIDLPSGGTIRVSYESDDYAYVQDKRASQMCFIQGVGAPGQATGLIDAEYIYVSLPQPVSTQKEMLKKYFEGVSQLYYKFFVGLDNEGHTEFVPGYASIEGTPELYSASIAKVKLGKADGVNPIASASWQFLRQNLPKYAYPGYENLEDDKTDVGATLKAFASAIGSIKELLSGFNKRAKRRKYADQIDLSRSWVRLCAPNKNRLGGGSRVRRVDITDNWAAMSETAGAKTATYSQIYDYSTTDEHGNVISSGVASYEPGLGSDENAFHQPIPYKQKQFLGLDSYSYLEEPLCESLFPAASVGYSKVSVKGIGTGDEETVNRTGVSVSEFYTAKDYPTRVKILGIDKKKPIDSKIFKLIGGVSYDMVGLSQGYSIELNDMHGKPKRESIFNKAGESVSAVEYYYKTVNENAESKDLNNNVKIIDGSGAVSDGTIAMDVETYSDMREATTNNLGLSMKLSGGAGAILFFPLPFFFPGIGVNYDRRSYRASSTIKIINKFAVAYKTRKTINGSSITSENMLWDAETGNVLLTKSQNEFDDPVFSFAYPAHWAYDGMGQAYKTLGTVLSEFSTTPDGTIRNSAYAESLVAGDELIDLRSAEKYWVINTAPDNTPNSFAKRLINQDGLVVNISNRSVKVLRSGRRNMAGSSIGTITSLKNPLTGNRLDVSALKKILDGNAVVFSEEWSMPVSASYNQLYYTSCDLSYFGIDHFIKAAMLQLDTAAAPIFSTQVSPAILASDVLDHGYPGDTSTYPHFLGANSASQTEFYQYNVDTNGGVPSIHSGDSAQLGDCRLYFDSVSSLFNQISNDPRTRDNIELYGSGRDVNLISIEPSTAVACGYDVWLRMGPVARSPLPGPRPSEDAIQYDEQILASFRMVCAHQLNGCANPVGKPFNPYYQGILGNWRPQSQFVYHVDREHVVDDLYNQSPTNIRKSGAYTVFSPFWVDSASIIVNNSRNDPRWVAANEVTFFNSKGLEIENKDALNRYSSVLFGYLESLPTAVASNARQREIAYDGFEDYEFEVGCHAPDTCSNSGHFNFRREIGSAVGLSKVQAHTGKFSLQINGAATIHKTVAGAYNKLFSVDNTGRYLLGSNELSKGFSPVPGKKYLLSFWIKDNQPRSGSTSFQASVNGNALVNSSAKWPVVEGWKRIEVPFLLSDSASSFDLVLTSSGVVHMDDIRILPYNGQLKSFAYDASSQRLMAELDENNFATLYEYDDEGTLIRVKKETERGIMTIRETRSSYHKLITP